MTGSPWCGVGVRNTRAFSGRFGVYGGDLSALRLEIVRLICIIDIRERRAVGVAVGAGERYSIIFFFVIDYKPMVTTRRNGTKGRTGYPRKGNRPDRALPWGPRDRLVRRDAVINRYQKPSMWWTGYEPMDLGPNSGGCCPTAQIENERVLSDPVANIRWRFRTSEPNLS